MADNIEIAEIVVSANGSELRSSARKRLIEVTLKNLLIEDLKIKVLPIAEDTAENKALGEAEWLSVPAELRQFEIKRAAVQKIPVTVQLPESAPPGRYPFHVLVSSYRRPAVEFSQTPAIPIELEKEIIDGINWRRLVAIAAGALALIGTIVILIAPWGLSVGDKCTAENASNCPPNSSCIPGIDRCALVNGATCKKDADCLSGTCTSSSGADSKAEKTCSPLGLGDECVLAAAQACGPNLACTAPTPIQVAATTPAPAASATTTGTPKCLATEGNTCAVAADCARGACVGKACGQEIGQPGCQNDAECPAGQKCFGEGTHKLCLRKPGQPCNVRFCTVADHCTERGFCPPDDGTCKEAGDCKSPLTCNLPAGLCQIPNGGPCTKHTECMTGFCQGTCQVQVRPCPPCPPNSVCVNGSCVYRGLVIDQIRPRLEVHRLQNLGIIAPPQK